MTVAKFTGYPLALGGAPYQFCVFLWEVQLEVCLGNTEVKADRRDGGSGLCGDRVSYGKPEPGALLFQPILAPLLV